MSLKWIYLPLLRLGRFGADVLFNSMVPP
jgi:hypothetical protein